MALNLAAGIAAAMIAGCMNGLFPIPMKGIRSWAWENVWLPFSILTLIVFPWLIAAWTVPHLAQALSSSTLEDLAAAFGCGILVYTGSLLFGISLVYIGVALSFALLIGSMIVVGVLAPLLLLQHSLVGSLGGKLVLAGIALAIVSVIFGFLASSGREAQGQNPATSNNSIRGSLLAIVGGGLSGLLPAGMAMPWTQRLVHLAARFGGASPSQASNLPLAIILLGGALPNCGYCVYLLTKNSSYSAYRQHLQWRNYLLVLSMSILYSASVALWGISISAPLLGKFGPSVGWALFVGMIVLSSTAAGVLAGEWKLAQRSSFRKLGASVATLVCSMVLICWGTYLGR